jgi:hypothetical protein
MSWDEAGARHDRRAFGEGLAPTFGEGSRKLRGRFSEPSGKVFETFGEGFQNLRGRISEPSRKVFETFGEGFQNLRRIKSRSKSKNKNKKIAAAIWLRPWKSCGAARMGLPQHRQAIVNLHGKNVTDGKDESERGATA